MAKRRMPPHIVLPNGMWRFVKRGAKARKARVARPRARRARTRRVFSMIRRRRVSHRRGMLGGSGMSGMAKSALVGIGAAHLAGYVPVSVPYKEEAAGALGAYMLGGKNIKSAAIGAAAVFLSKMAQGNYGIAGGQW